MPSLDQKMVGVVVFGGTAALAALDGGLSHLVVQGVAGAIGYQGHKMMVEDAINKDKVAIAAALGDEESSGRKDKAQVQEDIRSLNVDRGIASVASVLLGVVSFANPLIGLSCLAALGAGRLRKREEAELKRLGIR